MHSSIIREIKSQLAAGNVIVSNHFGDVLLRAWKDTHNHCKHVVSGSDDGDTVNALNMSMEDALQSLVHDAIHAGNRKYFKGLKGALDCFHNEKQRNKDIDPLLVRLYGPILWRSLRCSNFMIRTQASACFFSAFPLQDVNQSAAATDHFMQTQFSVLISLLKDEDHRVRTLAVTGVCHILRENWEFIPIITVKQILSYIVGTLGNDVSCAQLRVSVLKGLQELLDNPLSHAVMRHLLPCLSTMINDVSEGVRVAMIQLLEKVKIFILYVCLDQSFTIYVYVGKNHSRHAFLRHCLVGVVVGAFFC